MCHLRNALAGIMNQDEAACWPMAFKLRPLFERLDMILQSQKES